jgi:hypothetical protein
VEDGEEPVLCGAAGGCVGGGHPHEPHPLQPGEAGGCWRWASGLGLGSGAGLGVLGWGADAGWGVGGAGLGWGC